jgi:hypothetical protein
MSSGKLGSITANILTPMIYQMKGKMYFAFWIGVLINCIALLSVLGLNIIDSINDKRRKMLY